MTNLTEEEIAAAVKHCPFCDIHVIETGRGYAVHHRAGCFIGEKGSTYFLPHELASWNTRASLPRLSVEEVAGVIRGEFIGRDWLSTPMGVMVHDITSAIRNKFPQLFKE